MFASTDRRFSVWKPLSLIVSSNTCLLHFSSSGLSGVEDGKEDDDIDIDDGNNPAAGAGAAAAPTTTAADLTVGFDISVAIASPLGTNLVSLLATLLNSNVRKVALKDEEKMMMMMMSCNLLSSFIIDLSLMLPSLLEHSSALQCRSIA